MNAGRTFMVIAGLVASPLPAIAVPVTWVAHGSVETSDLVPAFVSNFIPELAGTQPGDDLVLSIKFDPDAAPIAETPNDAGGTAFSFDASSLMLELEVRGRGRHIFGIDNPIPGAESLSRLLIRDNFVDPGSPTFDGLLFVRQYLTETGEVAFLSVIVEFASTDTSILDGRSLPLSPDPRLGSGFRHEILISGFANGDLVGIFSSLVRLPTTIPEPGSLALLCLGLSALRLAIRGRAKPPLS